MKILSSGFCDNRGFPVKYLDDETTQRVNEDIYRKEVEMALDI